MTVVAVVTVVAVAVVAVAVGARVGQVSHIVGHNCRAASPESGSTQSLGLNKKPQRSGSRALLHRRSVVVDVDVEVLVDVLDRVEVEVVTVEVVHELQRTGQVCSSSLATDSPRPDATKHKSFEYVLHCSGSAFVLHSPVVVVAVAVVVVVFVRVVVVVAVVVVDTVVTVVVVTVVGQELQKTRQILERLSPNAALVQNDGSLSPLHSTGSGSPLQLGVVVTVAVEVVAVLVVVVV